MIYEKTKKAKFIKRPNRFVAYVDIDGEEEKIHVKNTGRCKELLLPGSSLILEDKSHIKTRKTRYSLISVYKGDMLVNMDSQVPNKVVYNGILDGQINHFKNIKLLQNEKTYKNSRFDLYYETDSKKGFIEIKGVTLENDGVSMFPDAPTIRGTKHVYEMVDAVKNGYEGTIFFLIQMKGPHIFKVNKEMDPDFYEAILYASENNVNIFAYDSIVTEDNIVINEQIPIVLD